jgi:electron transfer flavoprotein alpha subunit
VKILCLVDDDPVSLEAQAFARRLGEVEAITFAGDYVPEAWAQTIVGRAPEAVVAAGTDRGHEVMAHVAARLDAPLAANCVEARVDGDTLLLTRQRWGGSLLEEARLSGTPKLLTVAPHTLAAEEGAPQAVPEITPSIDESARVRLIRREEPESGTVRLDTARVVVGGGRGVGSAEGFAILEELAGLLGGAVGGSRVVTNLGWRPHSDQVGQTGARIAPELYIACGISGAIQHIVGCKAAKRILVINKDGNAPIVARAHYAVVGDLHEILPAVIAELRKAQGVAEPAATSPASE